MATGNFKFIKSIFEWEIPNFSTMCNKANKTKLVSPTFSIRNFEFVLELSLIDDNEEDKSYLSLFIRNCNSVSIECEFKIYLLNKNYEKFRIKIDNNRKFFAHQIAWKYPKFMERDFILDEKNGMMIDNKLIIACEVTHDLNIHKLQKETNEIVKSDCNLKIFGTFGKYYNNNKLSDVKFIVGNKEIFAHKFMLVNRSEVFAAMFEHNMKEKIDNAVEITDIDYKVLEEMFRFIYTDKVKDIKKFAKKLLIASDKYGLENLKSMCEKSLCDDLSKDNVIDYLSFADVHSAKLLKIKAMDLFITHFKGIVNSPKCALISDLPMNVVLEIFHQLASKEGLPLN